VRAADQLFDLGSGVRLVIHLAGRFELALQETSIRLQAGRDAVVQQELNIVPSLILHLQRRVDVHVELVDTRVELILGHVVAETAGVAGEVIGLGLG